jgi:hypothetical protein
MTRIRFFAVLASVVILLPATAGLAQDTKGAPPSPPGASQPAASAASAATPVYKPPLRGAPGGRIGGATRGVARDVFVLSVLAPDHTGLTAIEQPSLFWYISNPISLPLELTVMDPRSAQPLLETALPAPRQGGIQRVRLADHGVRLEPGVAYRWFIAVVADPGRRSRDILSGGAIERAELPEALKARLATTKAQEKPAVYAEGGYWYDALGSISDLIEGAPGDASLQSERQDLLKQIGLRAETQQ